MGVETVAVVASDPDRARLYFRYRPVRCAVGADPDLLIHRAYGVPSTALTTEIFEVVEGVCRDLARELKLEVPEGSAIPVIDRLDGFEATESEANEFQRHQIQFTGQFLLDREGIVRWANIECGRDGLAGLDKFPSDDALLSAARALVG
jgi:hypothetical protein